ncbi:MAG: septum formation initiator family protein [Candidatus Cloacimonetes bacterium]|nr:septum formation initiator family protein [Candidatus Cloacimonadota bacterium]
MWKLLLVACIVYIAFFSQGSFLRFWQAEREVQPQRQELETLRGQNDSLGALNKSLRSEDEFEIEKQARNWGMISEGDTIYHFRNEQEGE